MKEEFSYNEKGEVVGMHREPQQNWEKEFDKEFVVKSNAGTGLLRYTDADLIKAFIHQNRKELVEEILADIPEMISVEVGFQVTKKKLVQQLREKYLIAERQKE